MRTGSQLIHIELLTGGQKLRTFEHQDQTFVEALEGVNYDILLQNLTSGRVLVTLSVDGINAVDGKDASMNGPGYVLDPYQKTTINGWFRTNRETAAFVFGKAAGESYASQMGKGTKNVGVIGAAVYQEKVKEKLLHRALRSRGVDDEGDPRTKGIPWATLSSTGGVTRHFASEVTCDSSPMKQDLGTGYGQKLEMHTTETTFARRTTTPEQIATLRYASKEALRSWGVPVDRPEPPQIPSAFPVDVGVAAPPGWRG